VNDTPTKVSLLFTRGGSERSTITPLVPTLAHELSLSFPNTAPIPQSVTKRELAVTYQSLEYQLEKLVTETVLTARVIIRVRDLVPLLQIPF
jgi:hypothetical protein